MRVSVYKGIGEGFAVLLEPSTGRRLHPVLLQDVPPEDLQERVLVAVDEMRRVSVLPRP